MDKGVKSIFIYARISRDDKFANIESINSQIELLKGFASKQCDWMIAGVISDDNVSGANFDRPGLNQLMKQVSEKNVDIVLIKDLSRLGRSNANTLILLDWFEERSVRVISTDGRYDSKLDNELAGLETWYNERYIRDISAKTRSSLRHKQEQGLRLGKPPFGYQREDGNKYQIVPKTPEDSVVQEIFKMIVEESTPVEVSSKLNKKEIKTPSGGKYWNSTIVRRIIANQDYVGDSILGKTRRESFKKRRIIQMPNDERFYFADSHIGLVDRGVFERANEKLKSRPNKYYSHELLPVYCGECKSKMYRKTVGSIFGYVCSTYSRFGAEKCQRHFIKETILLDEIAKILIKMLRENQTAIISEAQRISSKTISKIIQEKDKSIKKLEQAYGDYLDGLIDRGVFLKIKDQLMEKTNLLSKENDQTVLENESDNGIDIEKEVVKLLFCDNIVDDADVGTINNIRHIADILDKDVLELFVKRIIVDEQIIIELN